VRFIVAAPSVGSLPLLVCASQCRYENRIMSNLASAAHGDALHRFDAEFARKPGLRLLFRVTPIGSSQTRCRNPRREATRATASGPRPAAPLNGRNPVRGGTMMRRVEVDDRRAAAKRIPRSHFQVVGVGPLPWLDDADESAGSVREFALAV
jgi:hypothetical protein